MLWQFLWRIVPSYLSKSCFWRSLTHHTNASLLFKKRKPHKIGFCKVSTTRGGYKKEKQRSCRRTARYIQIITCFRFFLRYLHSTYQAPGRYVSHTEGLLPLANFNQQPVFGLFTGVNRGGTLSTERYLYIRRYMYLRSQRLSISFSMDTAKSPE